MKCLQVPFDCTFPSCKLESFLSWMERCIKVLHDFAPSSGHTPLDPLTPPPKDNSCWPLVAHMAVAHIRGGASLANSMSACPGTSSVSAFPVQLLILSVWLPSYPTHFYLMSLQRFTFSFISSIKTSRFTLTVQSSCSNAVFVCQAREGLDLHSWIC